MILICGGVSGGGGGGEMGRRRMGFIGGSVLVRLGIFCIRGCRRLVLLLGRVACWLRFNSLCLG